MALKPTKDRRERWARLQADQDLLEHVCAHIANGGTPIDLAETWDIPFGWLSNWLNQPDRAKRYIAALNDRAEWARERVLTELRRIGLADIRKIYRPDGSMLPPHEWPDDVARAIAGVETDELFEGAGREREQIGFTKKVKFNDKIRALELLGKNLAMFVERHEHTGKVTLEELVTASQGEEVKK